MSRTHAQQFAHETLPAVVFRDPLAFTRSIANDDAPSTLAALWEQAGAELAPIARMPGAGFAAKLERRGLYVSATITPPAPRGSGDPAAIAIIGRGDGVTRLSTIAYYVLELVLDPTPRFTIVSRTERDGRRAIWKDGPLPDPRWLAEHAFELYAGRVPDLRTGIPELPFWYWWYAFDGANAVRAFNEAVDDAARFEAVQKAPIVLLPEIADAAELYLGAAAARRLRELRPYLRRAASLGPSWQALAERLASESTGSAAANATRALPLVAEAGHHGALTRAQAYDLEAKVRAKLAVIGVDPRENYALSEQLAAAAREAERAPRVARGSAPPPISTEDPVWKPLFLDRADLPACAPAEHDEEVSSSEPTFVAHGGLRAGYAAWAGDACSAIAHVTDARWVFRTVTGACSFMRAAASVFGDGLPMVAAPSFGDDTLAFGGDMASTAGTRRSHVIVVRVGRIVARLQATEGVHAAASRQVLHAAMLHPLAGKIVQRARQGLAAYWLTVASPTNAVAALVHSPGYDAARLLQAYPLLACAELPSALAVLGDPYTPVARALASFQAQLRAHRWATYRDAMRALVRALLDSDMGDPRVNAAHAYEIVTELRYLDADPVWLQLDAECRARG